MTDTSFSYLWVSVPLGVLGKEDSDPLVVPLAELICAKAAAFR